MQFNRQWTDIYEKLSQADEDLTMNSEELETLALAAYLTGKDVESFQIFEKAHHSYLSEGKTAKGVRCAFWLGMLLMTAGEKAKGNGWMSRAERILADAEVADCPEKGFLLLRRALGALYSGQAEEGKHLFEGVEEIGKRFRDVDLIALGMLGQGQAEIEKGAVTEGIRLLDETMITIGTDDVFPIVYGIVYCAVIETCRKIWDLARAQEWTEALTRWCKSQPDIVPFRGQCLVRRAEIIQLHGDLARALEETTEACSLLSRPPGETAAGEAFYRKAELLRLLGDYEEAENYYNEAAKRGRKPQPGLSMLRMGQGKNKTAEVSIENTLIETKDLKKRAELLPVYIHIMLSADQNEKARRASDELHDIAVRFGAPYLKAMSSFCRGTVAMAEKRNKPAIEFLEEAAQLWSQQSFPYEMARTREMKGRAYREQNDRDNAQIELAAAKWIFEQIGAIPDLQRVNNLLQEKKLFHSHGLTLRELQVLRLVVSGKTNKSVAKELFISERTVDRHVSNIFTKLNLSSRVEATSFAINSGILDN
ncbi:MAG: hypothetical protein KDC80_21615 [Saprospiraceae bacterium]|nr:hypothetical protein [Saprospiraceae bacterium]